MTNPLLTLNALTAFSQIQPEHVEPAIDRVIADNERWLETRLAAGEPFTWDNLIQPLIEREERLERVWGPARHLNSVMSSEALRAVYNTCLPKITAHHTDLGQNEALFHAYNAIATGPGFERLDPAQQKVIRDALRDFHLQGVDLPREQKARFKAITQRLSELASRFEDNVLDATQAWHVQITDTTRLSGLPDTVRALALQTAEREGEQGWVFNLEFPSYIGVMTHADDRELRREVYTAYTTRASDQGPHAGRWDNTAIMTEIMALRQEAARLLGFANPAERSLATKMAPDTDAVLAFLHDLAARTKPVAEREFAELEAFAREHHGLDAVEAWDVAYYSEKLRAHRYAITQEELRPYFPTPRVINGMFKVAERLFGIWIHEVPRVDTWHPDVRFFEIVDENCQPIGRLFVDPYARPKKRGGAWLDGCVNRLHTESGTDLPMAYLVCNFSPPVGNKPPLLTHEEVLTLFHEFGHGLQHLLTRVDYPPVAGINGVEWDAVEMPSQLIEYWCWERDALDIIGGHTETGEPMPDDLFRRLRAAKNFQSAMQTVRQLEFALFDFRLHLLTEPPSVDDLLRLSEAVRDEVAVVRPPAFNRMPQAFTHIFGGGYAAGYYSYKWAEVLAADAFARFESEGVFNRPTGDAFRQEVLEPGGSRPAMESFVAFRGREPTIDAYLQQMGLPA